MKDFYKTLEDLGRMVEERQFSQARTLLLDEISEMDLALQAKLLRVLQEGEIDRVGGAETVRVDVRVLATTNRDLEDWVKQGKFRLSAQYFMQVMHRNAGCYSSHTWLLLNNVVFYYQIKAST